MYERVKVETCPQCGAPVKLGTSKCEYCESEFLVISLSYLDKFDKAGINRYISSYKQMLKDSPDDGELNCAMGICYLDLGLHDLAIRYFAEAIAQIPDSGDAYYYYALALLKGKKPRVANLSDIRRIEDYLSAATQLDDSKSKYYYLWALVKYDYYVRNGLRIRPPTFEELMSEADARPYESIEIEKMLQRVPVDDQNLINLMRKEYGM